jgi:Serine dehydrogenase proteinase
MGLEQRAALISKLQELRGSTVVTFLTSLRPGVPSQISDDSVRVFFDHLLLLPSRPVQKLDLFLCSNGGDGTVPWRLVSLFREFAKSFCVLIPYRAYSAASLLALGADEIVMHPFAELGPIDPTVSNEFNPIEQNTGRRLGISVEDVTAYVHFIKSTVGIRHEDELVKALEILAQKVHPLALGNVERFLSQSRMIATKILHTHMIDKSDDHKISEIVENLASKLYFHGHPINRNEARQDIGLKVQLDLSPELETSVWDLYKDYESEFESLSPFNPASELAAMQTPAQQPAAPLVKEYKLYHAMIESARLSSQHSTKRRYTAITLPNPQVGQQAIREDILSQGWTHCPVPSVPHQPPPSKT